MPRDDPAATIGPYVLRRALSLRVTRWLYNTYYFWPGRVDPIARKLGIESYRVERFLRTLRRTSHYVKAFNAPVPFTCEVRYWRLGLKLLLVKVKGFTTAIRSLGKSLNSLPPEIREEVLVLSEWLRTCMGVEGSIHALAFVYAPLGLEKAVLNRVEEAFKALGAYGLEELGVVEGVLDNHVDYDRYIRYILEGEGAAKVWSELLDQLHGKSNPSLSKLPEDLWDESYVVSTPDDSALIYEVFNGSPDYSKPIIGARTFRAIEALNFNALRSLKELARDIGVDADSAPKYLKHAVKNYVLCFYPGFSIHVYDKYASVVLRFKYRHDVERFVRGVWGFPCFRIFKKLRINGDDRYLCFTTYIRSGEEKLFSEFLLRACREGVIDDVVAIYGIDFARFTRFTLPASYYLGGGEYRIP